MSKINKVIACIQILVFLCLILCSGGVTISLSGKSDEFPVKTMHVVANRRLIARHIAVALHRETGQRLNMV